MRLEPLSPADEKGGALIIARALTLLGATKRDRLLLRDRLWLVHDDDVDESKSMAKSLPASRAELKGQQTVGIDLAMDSTAHDLEKLLLAAYSAPRSHAAIGGGVNGEV